MGKLASAIAAEVKHAGGVCTVPTFLATLPKDVREDLDEALRDGVPAATSSTASRTRNAGTTGFRQVRA